MRINIDYLKQFLNIEDAKIISKHLSRAQKRDVWKELFASVGLETTEIIDFKGKDIFEIEITPNRPDWLSHYGVARDLHSKLPELDFHTPNITDRKFEKNKDNFTINIENKDDCGRYIACIIRNIEVKKSTEGIKELLESFGLRPINNLVDVSNLIVTTIGHPIHMFDLDKLKGNEINIRRAQKGEGIGLLDGKEIELNDDFLVIADRSNPVALAGIMGGEYSGVTQETRNILIESAYFNPAVIRKAAKKIGIKSEASFRFERGADILIPPPAINMALDMIEKSESHSFDITYYDDRFPAGFIPKKIRLDKTYPSAYSGIQISENIAFKILIDLGFGLDDRGDHWEVEVPSFRVDIYGKQDMAEEIIRVYGYDRLTSEIPKTTNSIVKMDVKRELNQEIRNHLTSIGFFEVMNYIFVSPEEHSFFSRDRDFLEIRNPLGKDFSILRKSLFPGLLKNILLNFNHSIPGVGLFEYGNQFGIANQEIQEKEILAIGASGQYQKENWKNKQGQEFDFFVFKSLIFSLFSKLEISLILKDNQKQFFDRDCSFSVFIKDQEVGHMGILKKDILDWYKLEKPVILAEFFVSGIIKNIETKSFQMWNKYPSYNRDLSFLMNKNLKYSQLEAAICELKPDSLENHTLFDRYQGKGIPEDKISLSMTFSYSNNQKTLINEEINEMHTNFINKLIKKFDLIQR